MSRARTDYDVVVIGAGPAGSTLAARLADYGLRVALLDKPYGRRQHVGESLPSSVYGIFDTLRLGERLSQVGTERVPTHLVIWGSDRPTVVPQAPAGGRGGYYVWRDELDRLLLEAARARGVEVRHGAAVAVARSGRRGLAVRYGGGALRARLVADGSGRAGVLARRFRQRASVRTLAITGHWRAPEKEATTWVEAFAEGWVWSAPMRHGLRDVTLMLDAEAARGRRGDLYRSFLAQAPYTARLLAESGLAETPRGCDATPYSSRAFAGRDFLLVGDAGSFLDPLSSHGVHKAMDSALAGAIVVRTILERPERTDDAVEFFNRREAQIVEATGERLGALYQQERRFPRSVFWKRRQARRSVEAEAPKPERRLLPGTQLRPAPGVRLVTAPVLESDFIERRQVIVGPNQPRGVRYFAEVCLPELFKLALSRPTAVEAARASALGESRAFEALGWLYRSGYLEEG